MLQVKATITGCIGAISLAIALFSPTQEITSADSLVGFASGQNVQTRTVQTNKGLMGLMFLATAAAAFWTTTGNNDAVEIAAPMAQSVAAGDNDMPQPLPQTRESRSTLSALREYVTSSSKNLLVVATGGSGKGIALSNMCRWRSEADPSFVVVWCDPKNAAEETGYFDHPAIRAFRFSGGNLSGPEIVEKVRLLLSQYREIVSQLPPKTPVWLILDEWTFILGKLKKNDSDLLNKVVDLLASTISMLDADNKHIVLVGQSPMLKDILPGEGGLAANLNTLFLFKRDDAATKMLVKAGQARVIPTALATQEALYDACDHSPRGRACFFDGQMWPTPELPNYGNYDRDDRVFLSKDCPAITNYADLQTIGINQPVDFDADEVTPRPGTAERLTALYKRSPSPAKGIHSKAVRFAQIVADYWEKNPESDSVALGSLISSNAALKKVRTESGRAVIEQILALAMDAGLVIAEQIDSNWHIKRLNSLDGLEGVDF